MIEVTIIGSHAGSQGFSFQQDGAPAHTARITQDWLQVNCPVLVSLRRISNYMYCVGYYLNVLCAEYCRNRSTDVTTAVK